MKTTKYNATNTAEPIKPGYKITKVSVIPEDWEVKRFESITQDKGLIRGPFGGTLKKEIFVESGYKVYEQQNAIYKSSELGEYYITEEKFKELERFSVQIDNFIVSCSGTIGRIYRIPENFQKGIINQALLLIKINPKVIKYDFFNYIFESEVIQRKILEVQGGAMKNLVGMSEIRKVKFPIPPLPEQKAIADCLSTWDKGIEKLSALITSKKEQKKGLMQQLLTGKKRLDGFTEEWKEVRLGEITKRITRKNKELDDTVVTISAQRGFVLQEDYFKKRVASSTLSNYYLLHKGEFAYNKSYSKGYPMGAFKRLDDFDKAVVTTLYICFKLKENVDSDFLLDFFEAGLMINNLMRIAQEGGRAHGLLNIGLADFFNLKLHIPDINEQSAIAEVLTTADKEIELLEKKLEAFKIQKKGLMQVLLTGEKRLV